jgi:predicted ATPase
LNRHLSSKVFVGRQDNIQELLRIFERKRSITILAGEAGIGKSALLEQFYDILFNSPSHHSTLLIGFYDQSKSLIGQSQSLLYPFVIALKSLVEYALKTKEFTEEIESAAKRIDRVLVKFAKKKGLEIAGAVIQDIVNKTGFKETLKTVTEAYTSFKQEKPVILAQDYLFQHKEEAIFEYMEIYNKLAEEFNERRFVLMFDQFESASKSSVDFLINFCRKMPENFHVIVSIKIEEDIWSDTVARELYRHTKRRLDEIGATEIRLGGLSTEDIGQWISKIRGVTLPLYPDLVRIRENSAGFPMLLNEWINQSETFDSTRIDRSKLCEHIMMRTQSLDNDELIILNKSAVLTHPLTITELAEFLNTEFAQLRPVLDRLKEFGLFERKNNHDWFKHELVQKCLEDSLDEISRRSFHNDAANYYLRKQGIA